METKRLKKRFKTDQMKKTFKIDDIDVNKILASKEEPYGINKPIKYFIGYRPLCMILPQMIGYAKNFKSNKAMSFKVSDN